MTSLSATGADRQVDSTVDLLGLGETILRHRWTIAICAVLFVALAAALLYVISPRYTATAQILIDPRERRVLQSDIVQQGSGTDMALVDSQIKVITSEAVLGRVVAETDLAADPEFVRASANDRDAARVAVESLARATNVTRPDNTYVLEISVVTKEPTKSARLANAIAAAYVADRASSASDSARQISTAISGRLAELGTQLREAEEKVAAFKREHNVLQAEGQLLVDRRLTDLAARQAAAAGQVKEAQARLQVLQEAMRARGGAETSAPAGGIMGTLRIRLETARQRLAELQQVLGPRHPRVTTARGEVAQAEDAILAESRRMVAAAQDDYRTAADTLAAINADLEATKVSSFSTNEDLIKLNELEREAQSSRVVYESFLVRAKETAQQENITARTARIIADAAVPAAPSFPPKGIFLVAAGLLGLFVGVLLAILRDLVTGVRTARPSVASPVAPTVAPPATPPVPVPALTAGEKKALDQLVLVTALDDPAMARQAALDLALDSISADHSVLFLDLSDDAPTSDAGFAEIAAGNASVASTVLIAPRSGLHILGAGRMADTGTVSRDRIAKAIEAMTAKYDEVVVNIGGMERKDRMPASVAVELTRRMVLALKGSGTNPRVQEAVQTLSRDGAVAVSLVSAKTGGDLYQFARSNR